MRYIDFDGVILDTEGLLFEEWRKNPDRHLLPSKEKIKYIQNSNWKYIIENSRILNDSIYKLKNMDPNESAILTKVHSLDNEAQEKIVFLRKNGVKQEVIIVPYTLRKTQVVTAENNILIDDSLRNLKEWREALGYPMFYDKNGTNVDDWGTYNTEGYQKVYKIDEKISKNM